ncbi:unnamed protein product, partial [Amoebophrya sp. A25]
LFDKSQPENKKIYRNPVSKPDLKYSFVPAMAKADMEGYYFQHGTEDPSKNIMFYPVPHSVPDSHLQPDSIQVSSKPDNQGRFRRWQVTPSTVALFGALSSVHECVHTSEIHQLIIVVLLQVLTTAYIDDFHPQCRPECITKQIELVNLYLGLTGWWRSPEKDDRHHRFQKSIT